MSCLSPDPLEYVLVVGSLFEKGFEAGDIDFVSYLADCKRGANECLTDYEVLGLETGKTVEVFLAPLANDGVWLKAIYEPSTMQWTIGNTIFDVSLGEPRRATPDEVIDAATAGVKR